MCVSLSSCLVESMKISQTHTQIVHISFRYIPCLFVCRLQTLLLLRRASLLLFCTTIFHKCTNSGEPGNIQQLFTSVVVRPNESNRTKWFHSHIHCVRIRWLCEYVTTNNRPFTHTHSQHRYSHIHSHTHPHRQQDTKSQLNWIAWYALNITSHQPDNHRTIVLYRFMLFHFIHHHLLCCRTFSSSNFIEMLFFVVHSLPLFVQVLISSSGFCSISKCHNSQLHRTDVR